MPEQFLHTVGQSADFTIGRWANHGDFWGAAAILHRKLPKNRAELVNLTQRLRNNGCSDKFDNLEAQILISWGGGPVEWVSVRDFPDRYQDWNPELAS